MRAGSLRHRITITSEPATKTATGGWAPGSTVIGAARMPADVQPLSGRELVVARQIDPRSRYQVRVRYPYTELTARMVVTYHARDGEKRFEVLNVNDSGERHREVILLCGEAS